MHGHKARHRNNDLTRKRDNTFRARLVTYTATHPRAAELLSEVAAGRIRAERAWFKFAAETGLKGSSR
ncbi:hypothetical protein [Mycolicibacterium tokaiense]|uniref:Uncharacterized protein n=1 Tax=Mycolicibacterium tokaiense TaxID=39695 RepID=A0A378TGQ9_9MYCO|nr:hypothetical protein [Mycolicibacterium tokaiense]BBY86502.1 hypothetical protein MTOK_22840 [Mycolicibacterium tokaiense]STZ58993.1 Uncharacterised protein [Mycolicibacterium tokaiense]